MILDHFAKEGKYDLDLEGKKVTLTRDHVIVEREAPQHLVGVEFRLGMVYLDTTREEGLVREGHARRGRQDHRSSRFV